VNAFWAAELGRDGARNLVRHKLRSTLTLLGVVFGVGAVITMLGIGEGAQRTVLREIGGLGLRNVLVDSVQPTEAERERPSAGGRRGMVMLRYGLTERDVGQIRGVLPGVETAVAHLVKAKVFHRSRRLDASVLGVTPDYFGLFETRVLQGGLLAVIHDRDRHRVAVVNEAVDRDFPAPGGALGQTVRIGVHDFQVVGVCRVPTPRDRTLVFIPYGTARALYGDTTIKRESGSMEFTSTEVGQLVLRLPDEAAVEPAAAVVTRVLAANHTAPDYAVTVPMDLLRAKQRTQRILNLVLIAIAAISLLVGGIGIMNIMLAIVTERIPEIGIRRAIGASRRDILWQFLTETVVLSTVGGLVGCGLGFVTVPLASRWIGWPGVITPPVVVAALAVSWLVGVVFGLAPALRAARLSPVECLRFE
jgi:putative ABC transport system permease protein